MMNWKDDLGRAIEALKDEDWRSLVIAIQDGRIVVTKVAWIDVAFDYANFLQIFVDHLGDTNDHEFCGVSRGKLLLNGISTDREGGRSLSFIVRNTTPWNHFWSAQTKQFAELRDSKGRTAYPYFDFNTLP